MTVYCRAQYVRSGAARIPGRPAAAGADHPPQVPRHGGPHRRLDAPRPRPALRRHPRLQRRQCAVLRLAAAGRAPASCSTSTASSASARSGTPWDGPGTWAPSGWRPGCRTPSSPTPRSSRPTTGTAMERPRRSSRTAVTSGARPERRRWHASALKLSHTSCMSAGSNRRTTPWRSSRPTNSTKLEPKLVVVGDAPYAREYIATLHATAGPRVVFTGGVYGDGYRELQCHALAYVQATEVGGTHPALVEAMGFGNCVLANDTPEHREVLGDAGLFFDAHRPETLAALLERIVADPSLVEDQRARAVARAAARYSWDRVTDQYDAILGFGVGAMGRPRPVGSGTARHERRDRIVISERAKLVSWAYLVTDLAATAAAFLRRARRPQLGARRLDRADLSAVRLPAAADRVRPAGLGPRLLRQRPLRPPRRADAPHRDVAALPRPGGVRAVAGGRGGGVPPRLHQPAAGRPVPAAERRRRRDRPRPRPGRDPRQRRAPPRAGRRRPRGSAGRGGQRRGPRRLGPGAGRRGRATAPGPPPTSPTPTGIATASSAATRTSRR